MLSAVIPSERSQPAMHLAAQLAHQRFVRPGPLVLGTAPHQLSYARSGEGPNALATFSPQLAYRFSGRTAQPLAPPPAPGCGAPTSRRQSIPSIWTLGEDQPVIP